MIPVFYIMGIIYIHCVPSGQKVNKEYFIEALREFSMRFRYNSQERLHPDNTLVQNSLLLTKRMGGTVSKTVLKSLSSSNEVP